MGYDQYTVPDDCSCQNFFCCFPLARGANIRPLPLVPFFQFLWRTANSKPPFLDYKIATKKQMHYDVTLHDVTANTNQIYVAYRNSLLSPSRVYLFQAGSMRSDSWVWREVKQREEKIIRREIREDHPLTYLLATFPAHIFLRRPPQSELTPGMG